MTFCHAGSKKQASTKYEPDKMSGPEKQVVVKYEEQATYEYGFGNPEP